MSAMTFTEDNCGTYPPSYPQRESLRLQRYNKLINYARFLAKKCHLCEFGTNGICFISQKVCNFWSCTPNITVFFGIAAAKIQHKLHIRKKLTKISSKKNIIL